MVSTFAEIGDGTLQSFCTPLPSISLPVAAFRQFSMITVACCYFANFIQVPKEWFVATKQYTLI